MKVIVDTSVWSLALRRRGETASCAEIDELGQLIADGRAEFMGPIRQELLSGIRGPEQFEMLRRHLASFPDLVVEPEDYVVAAQYFNTCRAKGIQGSNTDFLMCAVAARYQYAIFTRDRDFAHFSECIPIILHPHQASHRSGSRSQ